MAVDDVYQLTFDANINGREASNVFYYAETTSGFNTPAVNATALMATFFFQIWDGMWKLKVTSHVVVKAIWCRRIWPVQESAEVTPYSDEIGTIVIDPIPNGSCALISMTCDDSAKNFKRRTYLSGLSEAWCVNSQIPADKVASIGQLASLLASDVLGVGPSGDERYTPCAYSKKLAAASDPAPFRLISGYKVQKNIRSQRRRNLSGAI